MESGNAVTSSALAPRMKSHRTATPEPPILFRRNVTWGYLRRSDIDQPWQGGMITRLGRHPSPSEIFKMRRVVLLTLLGMVLSTFAWRPTATTAAFQKSDEKPKVTIQVADWEETQKLVAAHKGKIVVL